MTQSMVERVARALTLLQRGKIDGDESLSDEAYVEKWWRQAVPDARAAITTMREPTPSMRAAGEATQRVGDQGETVHADSATAFIAMIDEALRDG